VHLSKSTPEGGLSKVSQAKAQRGPNEKTRCSADPKSDHCKGEDEEHNGKKGLSGAG
jgi:hypothetical protein